MLVGCLIQFVLWTLTWLVPAPHKYYLTSSGPVKSSKFESVAWLAHFIISSSPLEQTQWSVASSEVWCDSVNIAAPVGSLITNSLLKDYWIYYSGPARLPRY